MEFYIDDLRLPVPIQEVSVKTGADINTISLVNSGEVGLYGGEKLDTLSFSSFFHLADTDHFANTMDFHNQKLL